MSKDSEWNESEVRQNGDFIPPNRHSDMMSKIDGEEDQPMPELGINHASVRSSVQREDGPENQNHMS